MTQKRAAEDFDVVIKRSLYSMPTCLVFGAANALPKRWATAPSALGWRLTSQKKCVVRRTLSSRQNLFVGCGVQVPDAFNNANVALKIQQMSRGEDVAPVASAGGNGSN